MRSLRGRSITCAEFRATRPAASLVPRARAGPTQPLSARAVLQTLIWPRLAYARARTGDLVEALARRADMQRADANRLLTRMPGTEGLDRPRPP
jgi:hypothetical protein